MATLVNYTCKSFIKLTPVCTLSRPEADMASPILKGLVTNYDKPGYQLWHRKFKSLVYEREIGVGALHIM